ncbi:MAG TPA: hypothetical protein VK540_26710 [Polyangiaceae bacterium]|nr:hypothetical protein [Polyangiaceae bacterium]
MAMAIRDKWHRTVLWRFRTGRGLPDLETAVDLCNLSQGRILERDWFQKTPTPKRK